MHLCNLGNVPHVFFINFIASLKHANAMCIVSLFIRQKRCRTDDHATRFEQEEGGTEVVSEDRPAAFQTVQEELEVVEEAAEWQYYDLRSVPIDLSL